MSIQVKSYKRRTPSGKIVTVKASTRSGQARVSVPVAGKRRTKAMDFYHVTDEDLRGHPLSRRESAALTKSMKGHISESKRIAKLERAASKNTPKGRILRKVIS